VPSGTQLVVAMLTSVNAMTRFVLWPCSRCSVVLVSLLPCGHTQVLHLRSRSWLTSPPYLTIAGRAAVSLISVSSTCTLSHPLGCPLACHFSYTQNTQRLVKRCQVRDATISCEWGSTPCTFGDGCCDRVIEGVNILEITSTSLILSWFSTTLSSVATVQAYRSVARFLTENKTHVHRC
jgi:hypothetical protein